MRQGRAQFFGTSNDVPAHHGYVSPCHASKPPSARSQRCRWCLATALPHQTFAAPPAPPCSCTQTSSHLCPSTLPRGTTGRARSARAQGHPLQRYHATGDYDAHTELHECTLTTAGVVCRKQRTLVTPCRQRRAADAANSKPAAAAVAAESQAYVLVIEVALKLALRRTGRFKSLLARGTKMV